MPSLNITPTQAPLNQPLHTLINSTLPAPIGGYTTRYSQSYSCQISTQTPLHPYLTPTPPPQKEVYQTLITIYPNHTMTRINLAFTLHKPHSSPTLPHFNLYLNPTPSHRRVYQTLITMYPNHTMARDNLAIILYPSLYINPTQAPLHHPLHSLNLNPSSPLHNPTPPPTQAGLSDPHHHVPQSHHGQS